MTIDVPLLIDIQNACQFGPDDFYSKINMFPVTSDSSRRVPRRRQAEFLATAMISCAAQHQRVRWRS